MDGMMSRPSAFTQRVYGVSFSVLNLLASSSETMAFLAILLSLPQPCFRAESRTLTRKSSEQNSAKLPALSLLYFQSGRLDDRPPFLDIGLTQGLKRRGRGLAASRHVKSH